MTTPKKTTTKVAKKTTKKVVKKTVRKASPLTQKVGTYLTTPNMSWVKKNAAKGNTSMAEIINGAVTDARKNTSK